jgi:hypothetical protein
MEGSWMDYNFDTTVIRAKPSNLAVPNYLGDYVFAVSNVSISYPTSFSLWKDGVIKKRVINSCEGLWWRPMTLSQAGGVATYTVNNTCGGNEILPYPIP